MATVRLRSSLCSVAPYSAYGCVKLHGGTRGPRIRRHCLPAAASERDRCSSDWQPPRPGKRCSAAYTVLADEDSENHHMLCLSPTLLFVHKPFERLDCNLNGFLAVRLLSHYDFDPLPPNNPLMKSKFTVIPTNPPVPNFLLVGGAALEVGS